MGPALVLFRLFLDPSLPAEDIFSAELLAETGAKVMTQVEATHAGFGGIPNPPAGTELRLVLCEESHAAMVQRAVENSPAVTQFDVHHIE